MSVEIEVVKTDDDLLKHWSSIKKVTLIRVEHRELLAKCLLGKAIMVLGIIDKEVKGVAVVERIGNNMNMLAVHARNSARLLMNSFYTWAKDLGVTSVSMMSTFDRDAYCKLFGVKHLTSIYEKDLTEWQ
jgi:hypothetical protein